MKIFFNLCIGLLIFIVSGCATSYPNKDVTGEVFPNVSGESLDQKQFSLPDDVLSDATLLLVGYVQNSQFDIDRWLIGLEMTNTKVAVYEIPAIAGMFPKFFETQINEGMRRGIPKELWKGVITLYDDGETVQQFTGNQNPNNARVVLLDSAGKVLFFHDRGFSVDALKLLIKLINDQKMRN